MPEFPDEILMRFADGELDPSTAAAVEAAMNSDEQLAARVAVFLETRSAAQEALRPMLEAPVPEHLSQAVTAMVARSKAAREGANVADLAAARRRRWIPANDWLPAAAAAAVAAIVGLGAGYWLAAPVQPERQLLAAIAEPSLNAALSTVPSGEDTAVSGGRFRAIATFRDAAEALCREFEMDRDAGQTEVAVACREEGSWTLRFAVAATATDEGYAPASSTETLDAYVASIGASEPLDGDDERRALETAEE